MAPRSTKGDEDRRVLWGGPSACGGLSGRLFNGVPHGPAVHRWC
jgi:hypothetical protein